MKITRAGVIYILKAVSICLAGTLLLSACQPKTKEQLYNKGVQLLKKGDARTAVIYLENALKKDDAYTQARLELAIAYNRLGKLDTAQTELGKVLKADPSLAEAHIELSRVYLEQAKPDLALQELGKVHVTKATYARVTEETGWAYALKNDYPAALGMFDKALLAGGDVVETRLAMAKIYFKMSDTAKTEQQLSEVLKKDPANMTALNLLASIQIRENNVDGALKTYARAGKADLQGRFNTGLLLMRENKYEQARAVSARIAADWPHRPEGYMLEGVALFSMKKYIDASGFLRQALTMAQIPGAHYYLGLCLYNMNEYDDALDELNRAINLDPSLSSAQLLAAYILMKQKRTDEAVVHLKKFIATGKDNALAHNLLGNAYIFEGKYDEGMTELDRAIAMDHALVGAHIEKGVLLLGSGKLPEAETELKTAVSLNPNVLDTRLLLASFYDRRGDYEKAMDLLKKGLTGQKTDAPIYVLMARNLLAKGMMPAAQACLLKAESMAPDYPDSYAVLASVYVQTGRIGKAALQMEALCRRKPGDVKALIGAASLLEANADDAGAQNYYSMAAKTGKPEGYRALAAYFMRKKRPANALAAIDDGISKNPSSAALYELKGNVLMGEGNPEGAAKAYNALEKVDPDAGSALLLKAYVDSKKTAMALGLIKQELAKTPGDIRAMTELSGIYMVMKRPAQALAAARKIIGKAPASPVGYMQLALLQSSTNLDSAIETLRGARVPKNPAISMMLGDLYFRKKAYRPALRQFIMAERLKPDYADAIYQQGVTLQILGQYGPAAAAYRKVLGMAPQFVPALNNLAYIYESRNNDIAEALRLASLAYVSAPRNGNVTDTYGFALLQSGRTAQAVGVLKKASMLLPGNPSILYHLALAYSSSGNRAMAVSSLKKCLGMGDFPDSGRARALLKRLAGRGRA
ncbi:MAG: PEP-CTERM system TPR-repeat protein PrsT [Nitrospiraceae bacterium]|nr:PEP-CTERM system TPR-repeat protein PrsT [Nitrospiraceae bacterium]